MKVFITGATGYIGSKLALRLAQAGDTVHILYRNPHKLATVTHRNIVPFAGTIGDKDSVKAAMSGCGRVFHVAALASMWERDSQAFERTNVTGTRTVLDAARECGAARVVFTSTAGVYGPSVDGPVVETLKRTVPMLSEYDRTKALAEQAVLESVSHGLDAVIVNPTRVYGPSRNNPFETVNALIKRYLDGKWRFLPGDGRRIGNYVYIDDVVDGHILAMERGRCGERYLLGGEDMNYLDFFGAIGRISGQERRLWLMPVPAMMTFAQLQLVKTRLLGLPPRLTPDWVRRVDYDYVVSSNKASQELGYTFRPAEEGLRATLAWIQGSDVADNPPASQ